jgi:CMP/dCMP kinase
MTEFRTQPLQVAIDGYAATGKSTVGLAVANRLRIFYLDTGVMYRAVALAVLEEDADPRDDIACEKIAESLDLRLIPPTVDDGRQLTVCIGDRDVTWDIRSGTVNSIVGRVANHERVRRVLIERQRHIASEQSIVMVGRDITSKVLPNAQVKVILEASLDERVRRRVAELQLRQPGTPVDEKDIRRGIQARDKLDSKEMKAKRRRAITIRTNRLTADEVVSHILRLCPVVAVHE